MKVLKSGPAPADSNQANVRNFGIRGLNRILRIINEAFKVNIDDHYDIYSELYDDIKYGNFDQVYTRIDVFASFYNYLSRMKKLFGLKEETLIEDIDTREAIAKEVWGIIRYAYYEASFKMCSKLIDDIVIKIVVKEDKNGIK